MSILARWWGLDKRGSRPSISTQCQMQWTSQVCVSCCSNMLVLIKRSVSTTYLRLEELNMHDLVVGT